MEDGIVNRPDAILYPLSSIFTLHLVTWSSCHLVTYVVERARRDGRGANTKSATVGRYWATKAD
jgi:hypothetical protein